MHQDNPTILIVDDDKVFTESQVMLFNSRGFVAQGCSRPSEILRWTKPDKFRYDLILLDMYLGKTKKGYSLNAPDLIPHLRTYAPSSKIVIYSSGDIDRALCLKCLELGALTILPKSIETPDLISIASVYAIIGNENETRERLIKLLWNTIGQNEEDNSLKGQQLEMLAINLFDSIPSFKYLGSNIEPTKNIGEIDILLENNCDSTFWKALKSAQIVVECKNRIENTDRNAAIILADKIKNRGGLSRAGIIVTMSRITSAARSSILSLKRTESLHIFTLEPSEIATLVDLSYFQREEYLRNTFSTQ